MISVIIVGHNSRKDLDECFDSILKNTYKNFRIILVDNDSCDDSLEFTKMNYPSVITIKNRNNGYAGGNNLGIRKAIKLKTDYIFLLNPDTIIDKECFSNLVKKANRKTILQPLILLNINKKNTDLINTTGGHLNFLGFSYCSNYKEDKSVAIEGDIPTASGAAVFIPVSLLEKVGMFDESFFMYHEDVDLSWRARKLGFNIKLIPASVVWHKYSFSKNKNKVFYSERNRLFFLYKNFSFRYRLLIFPAFVINELLVLLYSLFGGWLFAKLRTYPSCIKLITKHKQNTKKYRKEANGPSNIIDFISSDINFSEVKIPFSSVLNHATRIFWNLIRKGIRNEI